MNQSMATDSQLLKGLVSLLLAHGVAFSCLAQESYAPRYEPSLAGDAVEREHEVWVSDEWKKSGAEVVWVKSIWGRDNSISYNNWEERQPWGDANPWYHLFPTITWFKGRPYASYTESSLPHGLGDSVFHVLVGDETMQSWKSVAHYEFKDGVNSTSMCVTPDGRLMLTGIGYADHVGMLAAFSEDGETWTDMKPLQAVGAERLSIGQLFKMTWHDGKVYGLSRPGVPWVSSDGVHFEAIKVEEPADRHIGGNETASTFRRDEWIVFQRSGAIATSSPPYTQWKFNESNSKGKHSHGGPDIITLPDGQVIAGSRGSGYPKLGSYTGGQLALLFRLEGDALTPLIGFKSGGTMTGYPSFAWHDGHLYVAFLRDRPANTAWESCRGEFCVAKIKWPLNQPVAVVQE